VAVTSLGVAEVRRYLDLAAEIGRSVRVIDAHVHGTEVIFGHIAYRPAAHAGELQSTGDSPFQSPHASDVRLGSMDAAVSRLDMRARNRVSRLAFTAAYQHVGRRVLLEHMALAGVHTALLLPVAPRAGEVEDQMRTLAAMRGDDTRLLLAYSVPNTVAPDAIREDIHDARTRHGVRAVKLHPNITGIDLTTRSGVERIERIVAVCGTAGLPLIVHGGRSPILEDGNSADHAVLEHLSRIDWSAGGGTVVMAHAGLFGHERVEGASADLDRMRRLMERHSTVAADVSGLPFDQLVEVLRRLDRERIVFGSDALYFPMWRAVTVLLHALATAGLPVERSYAAIAGENPARLLFATA
jgi:predicted TIM-barrel fold metal-dependent hydrolase